MLHHRVLPALSLSFYLKQILLFQSCGDSRQYPVFSHRGIIWNQSHVPSESITIQPLFITFSFTEQGRIPYPCFVFGGWAGEVLGWAGTETWAGGSGVDGKELFGSEIIILANFTPSE